MSGPHHEELLLAIDAGGSVVKATVFELGQAKPRTVSRPVPPAHPATGLSERDPELLWQAAVECIREALSGVPHGAERVVAVGLTAHSNGLYLVDAAGRPTRAAVMSADTRAAALVRQWTAAGLVDALRTRSWNGLWAGKPGPILAVLAGTEPDMLAASHAAMSCRDYLWAQLTGAIETELSAASSSGLYDNAAWAAARGAEPLGVNDEAVEALALGRWRHLLGAPVGSQSVRPVTADAAALTGLLPGTSVVAGVVDNAAVQHGSGVFDGSAICVGAGTWSINQVLVPAFDAGLAVTVDAIRPNAANIALGGTILLCEASPTSASNLSWALTHAVTAQADSDRAAHLDIYAARLEREGRRVRRLDDPMFLPFIDGSRDDSGARGAWVGLSSAAGEDDLLGAVIEGICFEHRRHIDRLQAALPAPLPVRLSGGATKSEVWCQRFADVLGVAVQTSPVTELGSVCAAAMAGVSTGVFGDVASGVAILNPTWATSYPDPDMASLETARYDRYRTVAGVFDTLPWEGE